MATSVKNEQIIAKEIFSPVLSEENEKRFDRLKARLQNLLPMNYIEAIKREIAEVSTDEEAYDIDAMKYVASLSVLIDLSQQGWIFEIQDNDLFLRMEADNVDDKRMLRYRLSAERNAQFKTASVAAFVRKMEAAKTYNGKTVSIENLIGNTDALMERIRNGHQVCEPYVQLVTNDRDEYTGYKLTDIWRYFRYTWSIPYKTMPGRNLYYLVRDRLQAEHPVIGIFALGNSVLNLTVRDDDIGWTVEAIKTEMSRKMEVSYCTQNLSETDGKKVKVKVTKPSETKVDFEKRTEQYADIIYPLLLKNIAEAIGDIYVKDLGYHRQTKYPRQEQIDRLLAISAEYSQKSLNNKNNETAPDWESEAKTNLFIRKRSAELAKLLATRMVFNEAIGESNREKLIYLLSNDAGRKAINTALVANRKCKIGSNMMDIIVCGAIPPYNELLGGKLVSMLACSPTVIRDYTLRYSNQISEIASRMKGKRVIRDSRLVYLGTTSLYAIGSSQYNRIKMPLSSGCVLEYRKMGVTEGFGTLFFSRETTSLFSRIMELQDGGKRINHVFGEGTSPRFRMISRGLSTIGIRADAFLRHYSPRIVYSIDLAKNTKEFLMGIDEDVDYGFDLYDEEEVLNRTQEICDYWYSRWLEKRLTTVDIIERLSAFNVSDLLVGNI
ncbi:Druantia anti-phage system protein DruA [Phascolarctobacterium succinatutens]|uniref:Druantia anti-phage system protein DruA n=1 Tax=Phascolarctobacterium succinatutens TaxID=626940 RepID=UPI0023F72D53|nr:Druantia anti-phage system protein DruA [Phascolarctobacterium succinatutens]